MFEGLKKWVVYKPTYKAGRPLSKMYSGDDPRANLRIVYQKDNVIMICDDKKVYAQTKPIHYQDSGDWDNVYRLLVTTVERLVKDFERSNDAKIFMSPRVWDDGLMMFIKESANYVCE